MNVMITGATGLIGSRLVKILSEKGFHIKALVRDKVRAQQLVKEPVEFISGDLNNESALEEALQGCKYLFHLAADYRLWVPDPESMTRTNVEGTRLLMHKALEEGVERIVYTSSVCVLGCNADGSPADEDAESTVADMISPYKKSKFLAEKVVMEMVREEGLPAVIVNPSTPVGPGDSRPTPTGTMVLNSARDGGMFYADTGLNVAHVDDIALGHLLALEKGKIGRRYILGGDNISLKDLFAMTARITDKPGPRFKVPQFVMYLAGFTGEVLARLGLVKNPVATMDSVRMASKKMYYSSERAEKELGYTHRPALEAVQDAVYWFKDQQMLD
ncbi:hopanoid-associated sugar epimerase [Maridesulfovibrio salexigens]|uniref:Hopanoid-associated sugar epimerase n=1 Tax=Maridesulfovibrio salexigens (strain ATCC 14822 / DSM 2638 / NCIMB 8403 / VKM B-1763) TaxID=526222 RepID=C6BXB2_MARSD|nr:hopanoid-associated sugar epimerase [Maridesulfovibrio salexigens]ACS80418.1 hopanoid-associated sugar epimerase [Maridesulfovibrio salexigens DSM 2638]